MDSDDIISKDCIEQHLNYIKIYDADFSDGNVSIEGVKHNNFKLYNSLSVIDKEQLKYFYFRGLHVCGWNKLIRKSFLLENNILFKRDMLYEDILWVYQLCMAANKCVIIPQYTYNYIIREGSITTKKSDPTHSRKQLNSFVELFRSIAKEFDKNLDHSLNQLQRKWYNRKLLIVKGRILSSPLNYHEKSSYNAKLSPYLKYTTGIMRFILSLPFPAFFTIFYIPNIFLRKIR